MSKCTIVSLIFNGISDAMSISNVLTFVDQLTEPIGKAFLLNFSSSIYCTRESAERRTKNPSKVTSKVDRFAEK
jgi:hypothetical protein